MSDISYHCKLPNRRQPGVMSGQAVVAGTRVPVLVVDHMYREDGGLAAIRGN